jgi:hypothetical protein
MIESEYGLHLSDPSRFRAAKVDPLLLETLQVTYVGAATRLTHA